MVDYRKKPASQLSTARQPLEPDRKTSARFSAISATPAVRYTDVHAPDRDFFPKYRGHDHALGEDKSENKVGIGDRREVMPEPEKSRPDDGDHREQH